jgi:hypothetical protein
MAPRVPLLLLLLPLPLLLHQWVPLEPLERLLLKYHYRVTHRAIATMPPLLPLMQLQAEADDEPLALSGVDISAAAAQQLTSAWQAGRRASLYPTAQHFLQLVEQVS